MTRVWTGNDRGPIGDRLDSHVRYLAVFALLLWPAVSAADFQNSSFEVSYSVTPSPDSVPQYWRLRNTDYTVFGSQVTPVWKTEGARSAGLFSRYGRYATAGDYRSIYQMVNLKGMGAIAFDARLAAYGSSVYTQFNNFEAVLLVDDVPLWTRTVDGTYLDQQVDVSHVPGADPHRVELCLKSRVSGQFDVANWVQWDNLRLVEMPDETIVDAVVDVDPNTLNLNSKGQWITCYIELPGYDVNDIDGRTVTLEGVSAHTGDDTGWASPLPNEGNTMDHDGDGILERMVKFDRSAVQDLLKPGVATVTVKGTLLNQPTPTSLLGIDLIKVIGKSPNPK
jgi:hypothetical protein